jgi:ribonuclease HII
MQILLFREETESVYQFIAGVDEAGRGPLAGNVVAAAVILDQNAEIMGLDDSKKLSEATRDKLSRQIKQQALAYAIAEADVSEIDRLNILQATMLAMHRAVSALQIKPDFIYIDGNRSPEWSYLSRAVVKGDQKIQSIAAASILAKVHRDNSLKLLHEQYPNYGFIRHKGYPTAEHLAALQEYGASPVHRRSYAPVKAVLDRQ